MIIKSLKNKERNYRVKGEFRLKLLPIKQNTAYVLHQIDGLLQLKLMGYLTKTSLFFCAIINNDLCIRTIELIQSMSKRTKKCKR